MTLLADLNHQGLTIVLVTHEQDMAAYAARILTLHDGLPASDTLTQPWFASESAPLVQAPTANHSIAAGIGS